jgi:low affinity Fe/Cu permease
VGAVRTRQSLTQPLQSVLERFSKAASEWTGGTSAFVGAVGIVVVWALAGPLFHFSDAWQLVINSLTNIVTFLMVFLIQRSQNKDTLALQLKVNELIAAQRGAHNALIAIDQLSEDELRGLQARFAQLAELGAGGGHAVSIVDVAELPVDVPRNETD